VPERFLGEKLEVTATMPTGPLLGDLFEYKELKLQKKK
jgi:hypothetical protein